MVDDKVSNKICQYSASLEPAEFAQYHTELHKKDYSWQEREDRKNKGRKRPAVDLNVDTENADACADVDVGAGPEGEK